MHSMIEANRVYFEFARSLTADYSKSFYFSACLLPRQKRWATFALYGFCRHIDNLIDKPRERSLPDTLRELDFLEAELNTAYRTGESEHPVLRPFIAVAMHYGIPKDYPLDLIKGVRMDTENNRYNTFDDLYLFCYRVAGVVGLMMTHVLGHKSDDAFQYAEKLGVAMQLTNIIRDVKEDKNMGRIYFPLEELHAHGCSARTILDEHMTPQFRKFMKFQIDRTRGYYDEAEAGIKMLEKDAQFAIYSARKIYHGILKKVELHDYNPFLGRVFVPMRQKVYIILCEVIRTRLLSFAG